MTNNKLLIFYEYPFVGFIEVFTLVEVFRPTTESDLSGRTGRTGVTGRTGETD
jgi:hypothetical protein